LLPDGEIGEIVLKTGWPSMFKMYLTDKERYRKSFVGDWYFSGDEARRDAAGRFWFIGRSVPDPVVSQVVKAIVELKPGHEASAELRRDILAHGRRLLGAAIAPRDIEFTLTLPRTRSGKIMRRLLRARALGLPEGDLSTLESGA
jgi:acetyl-CoA synthetase